MKKTNWLWYVVTVMGLVSCQTTEEKPDFPELEGETTINATINEKKWGTTSWQPTHIWESMESAHLGISCVDKEKRYLVSLSMLEADSTERIYFERDELIFEGVPNQIKRFEIVETLKEACDNKEAVIANFGTSKENGDFDDDRDVAKDSYKLAPSKSNYLELTLVDTIGQRVEGNFDLKFVVSNRSTIRNPQKEYPDTIQMKGSFKIKRE